MKKFVQMTLCFVIASFMLPSVPSHAANPSSISIKLVNYIGNQSSLDIISNGTYLIQGEKVAETSRQGGRSKYDTANIVASKNWTNPSTVVIVNPDTYFADILSVIPLAYKFQAPILLTEKDKLTEETEDQLKKFNPDNILIIGGVGSISNNTEATLKNYGEIKRISGKSRYDLSNNIAKEMGDYDQAIVVTGDVYSDALAIAPYAAQNGYPILLTPKDHLPNYDLPKKVMIVGGPSSVSTTVENQIKAKSSITKRITGSNRYEMSANIIKNLGLDNKKTVMVNGTKIADVFVGSMLAAKQHTPVLFVEKDELPASGKDVIKTTGTNSTLIVGSTNSVSSQIEESLANQFYLINGKSYTVNVSDGRVGLTGMSGSRTEVKAVPETYSTSNSIKINGKPYIGTINFSVESGKYVRPVNEDIPFEDYLKGVIPNEMPASWPLESLKAQAVAARTYAIHQIGNTVLDTTAFQVYGGYSWIENSTRAVEETKGKVLKYQNELITAPYYSSNGGYTEASKEVWGSTVPYLTSQKDTMDPQLGWSLRISKKQINTSDLNLNSPGSWWDKTNETNADLLKGIKNWMINNKEPNANAIKIVNVKNIQFNGQTAGQRPKTASIDVDYLVKDKTKGYVTNKTTTISVSMSNLRTLIGATVFKSTYATVKSEATAFVIDGKGYGHGIGMSQYGAKKRAESGDSYKSILKFYYPGTDITDY